MMSNAAKSFDSLTTSLSIIILMVQQNCFQMYLTKFLDTSAKPSFPCSHHAVLSESPRF